jgi:hypothetical protein
VSAPAPDIAVPRDPEQETASAPSSLLDVWTVQLAEEASEPPEVTSTPKFIELSGETVPMVSVIVSLVIDDPHPLNDSIPPRVKLLDGLVTRIHETSSSDDVLLIVNVNPVVVLTATLEGLTDAVHVSAA